MSKTLYLLRHGETNWNRDGRLQGLQDTELNERGIAQAIKNAEFLRTKGIQHVYVSPLKRAYRTSEILAKLINVDIEIYNDLHEISGGRYEGMLRCDYKSDFGEENFEMFYHSRNGGMDLSFPNGETKRNARNRIVEAINRIAETTPYDVIAIVSHGFVLREFLRELDFEDDSRLDNCEIIHVEFDGKFLKIIKRIRHD